MWRGKQRIGAAWLWPLAALALGFWLGYGLLPHSGLAQALRYEKYLLPPALPFTGAWAGSFLAEDREKPPGLLLQAALPAARLLKEPAQSHLSTKEPVAEDAAPGALLATKAEPRLILMDGAAIAVYAAHNAQAQAQAQQAASAPRIAIYCTHSSEEYQGEKRIAGARGGVHKVAQELAERLNSLGLPSIYCDTIHDYPDWDASYGSSLASVQALQQEYPSLEMFIDVHRDSKANSVLPTANGNVARIMLVVGSDARLAHPNWQQNQAFSEQIQQALESQLSGITRGVSVQKGRYNQHISPQAILVEMGSTVNTTAEACASAALLAQAIAQVLD